MASGPVPSDTQAIAALLQQHGERVMRPRLHRDWAHPAHVCNSGLPLTDMTLATTVVRARWRLVVQCHGSAKAASGR